ncbi:YdcF family protein [Breznakia pachnodae]|uniref:Uncharacterized SAM-binding protein YcdF (DUF218 family) n=1 Tax=Breznakia pachnodae TaxID=265178 RepID=A0ABU0DYB2_9FIRM|nr:YdcF family protein [Breznakia pachnodae]MDQ0359627.1 uncharacterized SAM-binding protein YcdF (DUF218 family) [Breznakia pachnodae]
MIFYIINLVVFLIFVISNIHDRRKIMNGFLFNILLICTLVSLLYLAFDTNNQILLFLVGAVLFVILMVFSLGAFIIMFLSFINAFIILRKEGRSLSNMLTLFLGLGILGLLIVSGMHWETAMKNPMITTLIAIVYAYLFYLIVILMNYLMSSFIYGIYRPRLNKDYIIVLGSGLIGGYKVSPLLARRIDRGMNLYWRQVHSKKKKKKTPKIILSGGQGKDESVSEAQAMRDYALEQGIPLWDLLMEDKSKNTYENMLYSKQLIEKEMEGKPYQAVFATSNYHVFRSGIFARQAGLKAQGIGSKTPFYFWYNATLREYIAILVMYKRWHLTIMFLMAFGIIVLAFILNDPKMVERILLFIQDLVQ